MIILLISISVLPFWAIFKGVFCFALPLVRHTLKKLGERVDRNSTAVIENPKNNYFFSCKICIGERRPDLT